MSVEYQDQTDPALGVLLKATRTGKSDNASSGHSLPIIQSLLHRMYISTHILRLGPEARFSALVLLHRYIDAVGGKNHHPMKWVAAACLFLATKGEEEPRRLRDVINLAHMVLDMDTDATNATDFTSAATINLDREPPLLNDEYWESKKKIVETEQGVLRWLGFDVFVPHPHQTVVLLLRHLPKSKRDQLSSICFRRLNDAVFHPPALRHFVLEMACASIELAREETKVAMDEFQEGWWTKYLVLDDALRRTKHDLQESTRILKVYSEGGGM